MRTRIICVEGVHGIGKSTLKEVVDCPVVEEGFINMCAMLGVMDIEEHSVLEHVAIREALWMYNWIRQVEKALEPYAEEERPPVIFSDRSPISSYIYCKRDYPQYFRGIRSHLGYSLLALAMDTMAEAESLFNVDVRIVMLDIDPEVGFKRVLDRLQREPERFKYDEASKGHYLTCRRRYRKLRKWFGLPTLDVTRLTPAQVWEGVLDLADAPLRKTLDEDEDLLEYLE